mmetsp:Transcript_21875/g.27192  ORF Transcript_21875/g.27192 Transcript_21875/m.27192 type:complete len:227 (+) Transcript_21875:1126-1806(+)
MHVLKAIGLIRLLLRHLVTASQFLLGITLWGLVLVILMDYVVPDIIVRVSQYQRHRLMGQAMEVNAVLEVHVMPVQPRTYSVLVVTIVMVHKLLVFVMLVITVYETQRQLHRQVQELIMVYVQKVIIVLSILYYQHRVHRVPFLIQHKIHSLVTAEHVLVGILVQMQVPLSLQICVLKVTIVQLVLLLVNLVHLVHIVNVALRSILRVQRGLISHFLFSQYVCRRL